MNFTRAHQPALWALLVLMCFGFSTLLPAHARQAGVTPVEIFARPITNFSSAGTTRFGKLEFRGGLVLTSPASDFGGISGLSLDPSGTRFLAVSDKGRWFAGRIEADGDRPIGLADVVTAPMLGSNGRPLYAQGRGDVESLTRTSNGYAVGIERRQEIWHFPGVDPLMAKGREQAGTDILARLGNNEGIEALIAAPVGTPPQPGLIAIAERSPDRDDILPGFLFTTRLVGRFTVSRTNDFNATDMALADDGMVYLLERRFSWLGGVAMRIRRFPLAAIKPGAHISGEAVIEAAMNAEIDNMEALALHRNNAGELILTIMSDNNFSPIQRTLLLRFALVE